MEKAKVLPGYANWIRDTIPSEKMPAPFPINEGDIVSIVVSEFLWKVVSKGDPSKGEAMITAEIPNEYLEVINDQ